MIMACELDIQIDTVCVIKYLFASNSLVLAKLLPNFEIIYILVKNCFISRTYIF